MQDNRSNSIEPGRRIFIVDDNPADAGVICEGIGEEFPDLAIEIFSTGEAALARLRRGCLNGKDGLPDLIFLDLNMPGIGGKEVLRQIKSDPALRSVPVVILTTSQAARDIEEAYTFQANSYVVKPFHFDELLDHIFRVIRFWLRGN